SEELNGDNCAEKRFPRPDENLWPRPGPLNEKQLMKDNPDRNQAPTHSYLEPIPDVHSNKWPVLLLPAKAPQNKGINLLQKDHLFLRHSSIRRFDQSPRLNL